MSANNHIWLTTMINSIFLVLLATSLFPESDTIILARQCSQSSVIEQNTLLSVPSKNLSVDKTATCLDRNFQATTPNSHIKKNNSKKKKGFYFWIKDYIKDCWHCIQQKLHIKL